MAIKMYQVDAFTDALFKGNPAAVCVLKTALDAPIMQQIAAENNLAETAFIVPKDDDFSIRWFTPTVEVALCGHATLAAAHVLFELENYQGNTIQFHSLKSGILKVEKEKTQMLSLYFPIDELVAIQPNDALSEALGKRPLKTIKGKTDIMVVFDSEKEIKALQPDFTKLGKIKARGIIATAPGQKVDFVSRFFGPQCGINEDPVTGSAHTSLTPYWSVQLGKTKLTAHQISPRGGVLQCELQKEHVKISGKAVTFFSGEIHL